MHVYNIDKQGMSCEGACGHAHMRFAFARVRVRAKSILKSVRAMCDHIFAPFLEQNCQKMLLFALKTVLERPIFF